MNLGENIKKTRKKQGLTQLELAELVGVSGPMINQIENSVKLPTVPLCNLIAKELHVSLDELVNGVNGD